jgi:hypothetical protein
MKIDEVKIIEALLEFGRHEILREFRTDSCIVSTRIAIDVLQHFKIKAEAISVSAMVCNPVHVAKVKEIGRQPLTEEEAQEWANNGAWDVLIGPPKEPGIGHVVALTDTRILIDLSIDQANRPHKNIQVGPLATYVKDDFIDGKNIHLENTPNGGVIIYRRRYPETEFRKAVDWHDLRRREKCVKRVIRAINIQLM